MEMGNSRVALPALPGFISNHGGKNANNGVCLKEDYPAPTSVQQIFSYIFHLQPGAALFPALAWTRSAFGPVRRC